VPPQPGSDVSKSRNPTNDTILTDISSYPVSINCFQGTEKAGTTNEKTRRDTRALSVLIRGIVFCGPACFHLQICAEH
ncbi:MAG: hypothetical protein DWI00_15305, partial [Planctomycetota bacterium]